MLLKEFALCSKKKTATPYCKTPQPCGLVPVHFVCMGLQCACGVCKLCAGVVV